MTNETDFEFDVEELENFIPVEELETKGIWLKFPGNRRIRVRRAGGSNHAYARAVQKAIRPYRRRGLDNIPPEEDERIMREVYAHHVVTAWEGFEDTQKNTVPCTPRNVIALFKRAPGLFADVVALANEASLFSEQQLKEASETLGED